MRLVVEDAIFDAFPDALIGVATARDVDNRADEREIAALEKGLATAAAAAAGGVGAAGLAEHPRVRCWREAYRAFGTKPKKYPSSIENLLRRAVKGEPPRHVNRLVDLYNTVSLTHLLPAGGEDLDAIEGDLTLGFAGEDEPAVQLLGEPEARAPHAGEVVYRDDAGAVCRRWNWKEADRTKLTDGTRNAVLVVEALPPADRSALEAALDDLQRRIREHCGGRTSWSVLDRRHPATLLT